jgi:UTP--glucose-1-phosphate uridylyltransferase
MSVRKAVIPAAGLGTRFLPATKALPKEMIPVVDRPGIQYVVEEAVRDGLDDLLIITSRAKSSIEDHFDRSPALETHLEKAGKKEELAEVVRIGDLAHIHYVRQKEPRGFGDAVAAARDHVGDQPFVVMVADEIVPEPTADERSLIQRMIEIYEETGSSVIAVQEVPHEDIFSYGAIDPEPVSEDVVKLKDMVEKPERHEAPSNLASRGRYVFSSDIFAAIDRTAEGYGGEIQLTDAIRLLAKEKGVYAYIHDGPIFDVGKKIDFLRTTIELALRREDLAKPLRDYLLELVPRLG